ncbi:PKD domain-containing protein [Pseudoalteromonas phenolica]|nr:carboxypeptidase-like regulatory domain-containing protein [Pseudoalteromonas phenolica]
MKIGKQKLWRMIVAPMVFSLALTACGGGSDDPAPSPSPSPDPTPENQAPTVSIAELEEAKEQEAFTLTATATDSDGDIAKYEWSTDSSLDFTLAGVDTNELTVTSPDISADTPVTFKLTVTDNGTAAKTASAEQTVLIKRKVSSVTITGIVTDEPISNANVTVSAGESSVQTQSGSDGKYTAELIVDESEVTDLVQIKAQGTGEQNQVEFWSLLNSVETVIEQAGDDGILQREENFSVNVTNVTTAEYALISRDGEIPNDDEALKTALLNVDADEKLQLATLIKVVVDNPEFSLPEGVNNTLELVSSVETAEAFEAEVNEKDPTIIEETKKEIKEDTDLVTGPSGSLVGEYILQSPRYYNNLAYHLSLKEDSTGVIHGIDQQVISNWTLDGNKLSLEFANALKKSVSETTLEDQSTQRVETFVSGMSMVVLGENEVFRSVEVTETTYQMIGEVEQTPETVTYISNLTSKMQTVEPTAEMLTAGDATWYIDLDDRDFTLNDKPEDEVSKLIFNLDGTITSDKANEEITWIIEDRALVISYKGFVDETKQEVEFQGAVSIWLTKVLDAGYQVVTLDPSDEEWPNTEYGLFIKSAEVTVNETTMSGRWHGFYGLNQSYYMDLYPDGSLYFGLERSDYVWDIDGTTMVRKVYMQNGHRVESCFEERDDCSLVGLTNHEILAMVNDRYYIKRTFLWMNQEGIMEVSQVGLFIFEYNSDLSITSFDQVLPNYGDTYVWMQDASGNLVLVQINRDSEESDGVITIANQEYAFNFADGTIVYEVEGVKYVLEITASSQEYLSVCLYVESEGCTDEGKAKLWKQMPLMGNSIINNSDLYVGEAVGLSLDRWGNGKLKTAMTEHDVYWYVAPEGVIEINLQSPSTIYSNNNNGVMTEHKLTGYHVKLDASDAMKVSVTKRVDVYTDGSMTGDMHHDFMAKLYYERDFLDLSGVDFVGKWVAYDQADGNQISRVEFKADGTGTVKSTFDEPDENSDFTWSVMGNALQLQFGDTEYDNLHMTKDLAVGYQFVDNFTDVGDVYSSQIVAGILIKDTAPTLSKADYQGRWLYFDGTEKTSGQNGTEIYPEEENDSYLTFVFGTVISSYQGRYEDGQVIRARYVNPSNNERMRYCEPSDTCVLQGEMRYQMVAEHEGRYFWAREFSSFDTDGNEYPNSGVMFVGERSESTDIATLEDYHVDFFYLHQAGDNGSIAWYSTNSTNEMGESIHTLQIGDAEAVPFTFENGQMHLILDGQDTIIELVPGSNNKDGLTLCKYLKDNECTAQDHVPLFFNAP